MWWIALVACQDRAVEIVGRLAHIDPSVTHRAAAVAPAPEPAADAAAAPQKPIHYNPVSVPQESNTDSFSMPGVSGKKSNIDAILTD